MIAIFIVRFIGLLLIIALRAVFVEQHRQNAIGPAKAILQRILTATTGTGVHNIVLFDQFAAGGEDILIG